MFANILRPQKLANVILSIYFCYKISYFAYKRTLVSFWLNFSQKLANLSPGQNVGKHTPQKIWGALATGVHVVFPTPAYVAHLSGITP